MADRPTASTSRTGRPRTRSQSMHLSPHALVPPNTRKPRTDSKQKTPTRGKGSGKGKGKKTCKKSSKPIVVVCSDSEDLEVDFPNYCPNQPHQVPINVSQEPNPPADAPVEEQQEQEPHANDPIEAPVRDAEEPPNPGNLNPVPVQPPILMANNHLNWSHFRPEFLGKPKEDAEAYMLRQKIG